MRHDDGREDETDDEPCEECRGCEFNWTLKSGRDDMLRFVEHSHDKRLALLSRSLSGLANVVAAHAHNATDRRRTCARWQDQKRCPRVQKSQRSLMTSCERAYGLTWARQFLPSGF
jgi:hypothetical protein